MDNVAEKISFVELVERIGRLSRFLLCEQETGDLPARDIVSVFSWAVAGMLKSLEPVAAILSVEGRLNESDRVVCARKLTNAFSYFDEMHSRLSQVRGGWTRPEIHVFLSRILEFVPRERRPLDVSVILLNEYSFEAEDLASHARWLLSAESVHFDSVSDRPSVSLPKVERDNPLYWADLAHECGHVDQDGIDDFLNDPDLIPSGTRPEDREVLEQWAEEFYCDLFAIKILGPAYLASYAASALIATGLDGGEFGSETHPPDIVRICLMRRMLDKKNLAIPLSGELAAFQDLGQLFYEANELRNEVERHHLTPTPPDDAPQLDHVPLTEFTDRIIERIDDAVKHERELKPDDFHRTPQLAKRLAEGVLIGSYPDKNALSRFVSEVPRDQQYSDSLESDLPAHFARAKNAIQETQTLPWEIINAGWLHKVEVLYPFAFSLFFDGQADALTKKMEEFDNRVAATDEVLLKSIEVSQIHSMFGRPRE